jgi:hypothetical protein
VFFCEGSLEQVGYSEDAIAASGAISHFVTTSASRYLQYGSHLPPPVYKDELLDWDVVIEVEPQRASGILAVTLKYAGRGNPEPFDSPWDD